MKGGRLDESLLRAWVLVALLSMCRPSSARLRPSIKELHALTDFANANANAAMHGRSLRSWRVGFNAEGNWTGRNPCVGYKGLRCWSTGHIRMLSLKPCGLNGTISPALGNLTFMNRLSLAGNQLSGDVGLALAKSSHMKILRLQDNQLTGSVAIWVQKMVGLVELSLAANCLGGPIPFGVFSNHSHLQIVDISNNSLYGPIPDDLVRLPSLTTLLLSGNNFTGTLGESLSVSSLGSVDLSRNSLSGLLPTEWSTPNLTFLDLSSNNLSGPIPTQLLNISNLKTLNLAHNKLEGNVTMAFSRKFGCIAFQGNPGLVLHDPLCAGRPLPPGHELSPPGGLFPGARHHRRPKGLSTLTIVALTAGDVALLLMSAAGFTLFWIWWKKRELRKEGAGRPTEDDSKLSSVWPIASKGDEKDTTVSSGGSTGPTDGARPSFVARPALRPALKSVVGTIPDPANSREYKNSRSFDQSISIDDFGADLVILDSTLSLEFDDLLSANAIVLGAGSFGSVYMAVLEDRQMLAIKRLDEEVLLDEHAFCKQCTQLADVLHPNLLQMRAYCWSPQEKLLIFDCMPNGSVHSLLHDDITPEPRKGTDWATRLKIAVGTARALAHLHDNDMVHGNLKATNVLLDEHFEPRVSDFGLEELLQTPSQHIASVGYLAPELGFGTRRRSQDSDVYSLGVLLLELLTGREPMGKNNWDLTTWVQEMTSSNRTVELFDPAMVSMHVLPAQDVLEFLELAQACVSEDARARPSITIVLRSLESIVPGSTAPRSYVQDDSHDTYPMSTDDASEFRSMELSSEQYSLQESQDGSEGESPESSESFYSDFSSSHSSPLQFGFSTSRSANFNRL